MKIVILAAGRSSRFTAPNDQSKIFADFWGISVLNLILEQVRPLDTPVCLIVNEKFNPHLEKYSQYELVTQQHEYGTGAAIKSYIDQYSSEHGILILPSDTPLIETETLRRFMNLKCDVGIGIVSTPNGHECYGRIIQNDGKITKIAEYKDHNAKTEYINSGIIYLSPNALKLISKLKENVHSEIFLTDIVEEANQNGLNVEGIELNLSDTLGFNTRSEYLELLKLAQKKWRIRAINSGAILQDPDSTYLSYDTFFELGAIIEPNCKFGVGVQIKQNAIIKSFSYLENCVIDGVVGPFAHIKSGTIAQDARVGAFVEVKNSCIQSQAKIKHLAYIGDATIGKKSNIGAGVVICNFDGNKKHKTIIEDEVFVGANSTIIAPITIQNKAFLAAGSTYTDDVKKNQFAIARTKQTNKNKENL